VPSQIVRQLFPSFFDTLGGNGGEIKTGRTKEGMKEE